MKVSCLIDNGDMKKTIFASICFFLMANAIVEAQEKKTILIFGDSITAGYGIEPQQAFPSLIQERIDSLGLNYEVINGGLSGETSAGGARRIGWVMQRNIDVMVLELGGNDGLRGIDLSSTKANLQQIIDKAKEKNPDMEIIIAGMQVPPNLGTDYTREFQNLYPDLAKKNDLTLIPLILDKVGGRKQYMQSDQIHPNIEGHKIIAKTVWEFLFPVL